MGNNTDIWTAMDYDLIIKELGDFGLWHLMTCTMLVICQIAGGAITLSSSFAGMISISIKNRILIHIYLDYNIRNFITQRPFLF